MTERISPDSLDKLFGDMLSERELEVLGGVDSVDCQSELGDAREELSEIVTAEGAREPAARQVAAHESTPRSSAPIPIDAAAVELLREGGLGGQDIEIDLDPATLCMLVASSDGAWKKTSL